MAAALQATEFVGFCVVVQGEKNNGFDVLYQNMKYGLDASKEFSDFLRERYVFFCDSWFSCHSQTFGLVLTVFFTCNYWLL